MMRSLRLVPFRLLALFGIPFSLFLVGILGGSAQINAAGIEFQPLQPSSAQVSVSRNIARGLEYSHFRSQRLRSEEHTSELQSRPHLVCRLLLEKKNNRSEER